jgi:hypothetical protein
VWIQAPVDLSYGIKKSIRIDRMSNIYRPPIYKSLQFLLRTSIAGVPSLTTFYNSIGNFSIARDSVGLVILSSLVDVFVDAKTRIVPTSTDADKKGGSLTLRNSDGNAIGLLEISYGSTKTVFFRSRDIYNALTDLEYQVYGEIMVYP